MQEEGKTKTCKRKLLCPTTKRSTFIWFFGFNLGTLHSRRTATMNHESPFLMQQDVEVDLLVLAFLPFSLPEVGDNILLTLYWNFNFL
jgi:hypothetical protein